MQILTNGQKPAYTLQHTDTGLVEEFKRLEDIPMSIRNYFEGFEAPKFCSPELSHILGLNRVFYPDWPKACGHPDRRGRRCIADTCRYADGEYKKCPYFSEEKLISDLQTPKED